MVTATHAAHENASSVNHIRRESRPTCCLCGALGSPLYQGLRDRYFAAEGMWNIKRCQNAACGLLWLDPTPAKQDLVKAYSSYYTHTDLRAPDESHLRSFKRAVRAGYLAYRYGYDNGGARWMGLLAYLAPLRRAGLDFSVMYVPQISDGRLLEVGCGSGDMLKDMADLGWQVEGIDLDPAAVENSRRKGLNVRMGSLEEMGYRANWFDLIIMSHVIEHVYDPFLLLTECRRILKSGGRLVLVTPNVGSMGHRIYRSSWFHLDPPRHLRLFTVDSLTTLLQSAGFLKTKVITTIRDAGTVYVASQSVRRTARYQIGSLQPRSARLFGKAMQLLEWAWLMVDGRVGEEIAAIARK